MDRSSFSKVLLYHLGKNIHYLDIRNQSKRSEPFIPNRTIVLSALLGLIATAAAANEGKHLEFVRPTSIPFPADAPYNPQIATLGKMLFFDPRISGAQNMSCASCHNPSFGWETPVETAVGAMNEPLGRHAPTILNSAWVAHFFWDGRAATLEEQAAGPITAAVEMNATLEEVVDRLSQVAEYTHWFDRLFPETGLTADNILLSIATYERTVVSGWAPFDDWVAGDADAVSESAKRGFDLFVGKANCASCHSGWNFTDNAFHDIGLRTEDVGRAALEPNNPQAQFAFKTPGLRNIALRAPFMHNGQVPDLHAVIAHYATGGFERPSLAPQMSPLELTPEDLDDLVAFLETLTESETILPTPILPAN
jgi:cytochrome c peroxidase